MGNRLLYGIGTLVTLATIGMWLVNIKAVIQSGSFWNLYALPTLLATMVLLLWVEKRLWTVKESSPTALVLFVTAMTLALSASSLLRG